MVKAQQSEHEVVYGQLSNKNMKITNSADTYEDSGLRSLIYELDLKTFFQNKDYGNNKVKLFFVINCLLSHIKERRPRFDSKRNVLEWDVMLDYETVKNVSVKEKKIMLANRMINSFDVLDKYKKLSINKDAIKRDMEKYFIKLRWI